MDLGYQELERVVVFDATAALEHLHHAMPHQQKCHLGTL